ncbi:receptor-like protein EIX1 isoform X2 [Rosa rugosa]|uniref:receptor-like protein EIX1 isoform X2 n=1 Tax=Rosa rugosa TaxID=74645 RepID=UPI002B40CA60|nr:receptor-like protein EIX1 isoform X2 [Rosa rugosa]
MPIKSVNEATPLLFPRLYMCSFQNPFASTIYYFTLVWLHIIFIIMFFSIMSGGSMHSGLVGLVCLAIASAVCCSSVGSSNNIMCLESERHALLRFKQGLVDDSNALASWKSEKDCCKWRGIECNNQTGHVTTLDFSFRYDVYVNYTEVPLRGEISPSLLELPYLNYLDLSYNDFEGTMIPKFIGSLSQLKQLRLRRANFSGPVPPQLGNLSNLHTLDLSSNDFEGTMIPKFIGSLSQLKELILADANFSGPIPPQLGNLSNLHTLYLSSNDFEGGIPKGFQNLCSLESLGLAENQLSENIEDSVETLSCAENTLETLDLSDNLFWGSLPDLARFSKLRYLYLDSNQVNGSLPESVGQLSSLELLDLSGNSLSGVITEAHFLNLSRLQILYISGNRFSINLSSDWNPPFQLTDGLGMSSCKVGPAFPKWILTQTNLTELDLSNAGLSGSLPIQAPNLQYLDISKNLLSGELPNCWMQYQELQALDLGKNKLSGKIPSSLGNLQRIQVLRLHDNNFSGELPSFENCTELRVVDLGNNNLSGKIPTWIGQSLPKLVILRLRSNEFNGIIPFSLCSLAGIHVLDLSHNNISGGLPHCFNNITALAQDYIDIPVNLILELVWKGIEIEFGENLAGMRSIDMSRNCLMGEIPQSIANMIELKSLNLSTNYLTGKLPENFGNMKMLESLDLSRNQISGKIPTSFASLSFLSVLDLSHNKLSGRIPSGTQLQGFNASQYMGNDGLCGPPLTPNCSRDGATQADDNKEHDNDGLISLGFFISVVLGFVTGFWMVCGSLLLKTSWRYAYFNFLDNAKGWIYVKTAVYKAKVQRRLQRSMEILAFREMNLIIPEVKKFKADVEGFQMSLLSLSARNKYYACSS